MMAEMVCVNPMAKLTVFELSVEPPVCQSTVQKSSDADPKLIRPVKNQKIFTIFQQQAKIFS